MPARVAFAGLLLARIGPIEDPIAPQADDGDQVLSLAVTGVPNLHLQVLVEGQMLGGE